MTTETVFALAAIAVFCLGLYSLITSGHLIRKIVAINMMGSAIFLFLGSIASRNWVIGVGVDGARSADPVPQAMVITGIVVAVAATALALALARRIHAVTGQAHLPEEREDPLPTNQ